LPFTLKKYIKAKEELWKFKYLATQISHLFLKNELWQLRKKFVTKEDTERRPKGLGQNGRIIDDAKSA
jgi:hypothetical protein